MQALRQSELRHADRLDVPVQLRGGAHAPLLLRQVLPAAARPGHTPAARPYSCCCSCAVGRSPLGGGRAALLLLLGGQLQQLAGRTAEGLQPELIRACSLRAQGQSAGLVQLLAYRCGW